MGEREVRTCQPRDSVDMSSRSNPSDVPLAPRTSIRYGAGPNTLIAAIGTGRSSVTVTRSLPGVNADRTLRSNRRHASTVDTSAGESLEIATGSLDPRAAPQAANITN